MSESEWKTQIKRTEGRFALIRTTLVENTAGEEAESSTARDTILISSSDDRSDLDYYIQFRTELWLRDSIEFEVVDTESEDFDEKLRQL